MKTQNRFQIGKHRLDAVVRIRDSKSIQFFESPQKTHVSFYAVIGATEVLVRVVHLPVGMQRAFFQERLPLAFPFAEQPFKRRPVRVDHEVRQVQKLP